MKKLTSIEFDCYRKMINNMRERKKTWDDILLLDKNSEEECANLLNTTIINTLSFPKISLDEWKELVEMQKMNEEESLSYSFIENATVILSEWENNDIDNVPEDCYSSWQLYKNKLKSNGFKKENIDEIENTTFSILKKLSSNTIDSEPIKGMVIGNVQSGKTANMTALIAMAADYGWNLFIVLSGTIENLRVQTEKRLYEDLNCSNGNLKWELLRNLSKNSSIPERLQDLFFENNSKNRYLNVCLKNSSRLKNLITWLQSSEAKKDRMKILLIDDEADQASINTADINNSYATTINRYIKNIVNNKDVDSKDTKGKFKAMNYIGYTATPYANILNESGNESLYPSNFIVDLKVANEYFGPQQVFGVDDTDGINYDGLDIIRIVNNNDLDSIKSIHDYCSNQFPVSFENSLCWFLCATACMRIWGVKKPSTMLIHTSYKTDHHEHVAKAIFNWFSSNSEEYILNLCKNVWSNETCRFNKTSFRQQYPNYGRKEFEMNDYPEWELVKKQIEKILSINITNIPLNEYGDLEYHEGIHLCIDNCKNSISEDDMYIRLAYPEEDNMPNIPPAFIVIGGTTLSRGLTIEGLVCTFFIRCVTQADTLMQMGRWFGYRKNYELLPRIWMTSKTLNQFKFLSKLDQDLRDEIREMKILGKSPKYYGPRVNNTPMVSFIRITAKNKMQCAQQANVNYSGAYHQTYLFDNDENILKGNIILTEKFIKKLGKTVENKECYFRYDNNLLWEGIEFELIKEYLSDFSFNKHMDFFNNLEMLFEWVEKVTKNNELENWNVIIASKKNKNGKIWNTIAGPVTKVNRSKKIARKDIDTSINIGVLVSPSDLCSDINIYNYNGLAEELDGELSSTKAKKIRYNAGLGKTPQLIIYMIDKESTVKNGQTDKGIAREDLNSKEDIIGLCVNIPGDIVNKKYVEKISININKNPIVECDLGDEDAN